MAVALAISTSLAMFDPSPLAELHHEWASLRLDGEWSGMSAADWGSIWSSVGAHLLGCLTVRSTGWAHIWQVHLSRAYISWRRRGDTENEVPLDLRLNLAEVLQASEQ